MPRAHSVLVILALATVARADEPTKQTPNEPAPTANAVKAVLDRQRTHWNAGEIERFLDDYWKSPDLTFSSGGQTRRGFAETRARYLASYPTPERMGRLAFSELEVTPLGDGAAFALGRWRLERGAGEGLGGNFTLVLRRIEGRWVIVHDHTSNLPSETKP